MTTFHLCVMTLLFLSVSSLAAPPEGANPNSEIYKWFDRQVDSVGHPCCGQGDGQLLEPDEWRVTNDGTYEVFLIDRWRPISVALFTKEWKKDPNRTGKAAVWWNKELYKTERGKVTIYCFSPGELL